MLHKNAKPVVFPETPECVLGFTQDQVKRMFGTFFTPKFFKFMDGQTTAACSCQSFNHETRAYEKMDCRHPAMPIQTIFYVKDVQRFVRGLPNID